MEPHDKEPADLIEKNADGSFTKETLARAMKALKKRSKVTRCRDGEARRGGTRYFAAAARANASPSSRQILQSLNICAPCFS